MNTEPIRAALLSMIRTYVRLSAGAWVESPTHEPLREVFDQLRHILVSHAAECIVAQDTGEKYALEAPIGPATLESWKGRVRSPRIPVAWVEVRRGYVGYHLMGLPGNRALLDGLSRDLRRQLKGKACFNIEALDGSLVEELKRITAESLEGMRRGGFVSEVAG